MPSGSPARPTAHPRDRMRGTTPREGTAGRWRSTPADRIYSLRFQFGDDSDLRPAILVAPVKIVPKEESAGTPEVAIEIGNTGLRPLRIQAIGRREWGGPFARIPAPVPFSIPPRATRSIAIGLEAEDDGIPAAEPILVILSDDPDRPRIEVLLPAVCWPGNRESR
jgi:hypothetical protein